MSTLYCRHIRPSGRRCQSAALRGQPLCFHHASAKAHLRALHPPEDGTSNILHDIGNDELDRIRREPLLTEYYAGSRGPVVLQFPPLEDANAVQLALSMVIKVLGQNRLDLKRAAAMLYALQIAAANARNLSHDESHAVSDITQDDAGNILSPDEDPEQVQDTQRFIEEFRLRHEADEPDDENEEEFD